jgi:hypothetical protein
MTSDRDGHVIKVDELPGGENASTFDGYEHGAQVSFFLSHNKPGTGPQLHRHPYEETVRQSRGDASPGQHPSGRSHGDRVAGVTRRTLR